MVVLVTDLYVTTDMKQSVMNCLKALPLLKAPTLLPKHSEK